VAGTVLDELRRLNADASPMGSLGAVVGATIAGTGEDLDVNGPLLVPGIGAQGGTADDVRRIFGRVLHLVLPSSSREILGAGPDPAALRAAVGRSVDAFGALRTGR
jgi:orotidine-5'-phosphate decarboxylase